MGIEFTSIIQQQPQITPDLSNQGAFTLQKITDKGSTTTNVITGLAAPTFTHTDGKLTGITYSDGTTKVLTYNIDDTLDTITISKSGNSAIVKTLVWDTGVLQSISIV